MAKRGFVPALGTPLDENGALIPESYKRQIELMIGAGCVGLLSMGSMGQQAFLLPETCAATAACAVEAAAGRVPVFCGAMDNSIARAKRRIAAMEHLDVHAFVLTTPYYEVDTKEQVLKYFREVAASTKHGIFLYDLPGVTKFKITLDMVKKLRETTPNFIGMKSADINMLRKIRLDPAFEGFEIFYSGLDNMDVAFPWGVGNILDGMFTCTPATTKRFVDAMENGDRAAAGKALNEILDLRDYMCKLDLWPAYSAGMNLLGCEGLHAPDWSEPSPADVIEKVREAMVKMGEPVV